MARKVPRELRLAMLPESHVVAMWLGGGGLGVEWEADSGRCTSLVDNECRIIQRNACMSEGPTPERTRGDPSEPTSGEERVRGVRGSVPLPSRSGIGRHVQAEAWRTPQQVCDGKVAGRTHLLATTMLRQTPRISRSTVRLLADPKPSQKSALPNARSLHQRTLVHPCRISRNPVSVASTSASIPRLPTRGVEGLQTRSFASTSKNSARHTRSDDRHRRVVNRPLVGTTDGDLPRKNRRANPFLPFQTSSFVDAFVTTIVGVGISESCKYERWGRTEAEWTLA
jgi:hypothetical protein